MLVFVETFDSMVVQF